MPNPACRYMIRQDMKYTWAFRLSTSLQVHDQIGDEVHEVSLLVPDLTGAIFQYLCTAVHVIISFLASFLLLCLNFNFPLQCSKECLKIDVEREVERMRPKQRELHELPYKESVKSGTRFWPRTESRENSKKALPIRGESFRPDFTILCWQFMQLNLSFFVLLTFLGIPSEEVGCIIMHIEVRRQRKERIIISRKRDLNELPHLKIVKAPDYKTRTHIQSMQPQTLPFLRVAVHVNSLLCLILYPYPYLFLSN